ncbi:hypothetical protein KDA_41460 [Dictyobacter alpinus]|uniref:histidine kinase n=1 Tax=Dictyobacter alpinus TaxID=2014873 RepID=A0A402BBI3_9CHLR|nr:ATP-binding protein [Dictyobacter alpinus]GCE28662.1 hypothetical protein KDA_41460 [Dictyobacter alpinus]
MRTMVRTRTVLLIEDSPEDCALIRRYLTNDPSQTYTLIEVNRGREGIRMYHETPPDVILLDYYLPDMDGSVFLERLQHDPANALIPVVVLTGSKNEELVIETLRRGAVDYITKDGLTPETLRVALYGAIEKGLLRRQVEANRIELEHSNCLLREQQARLHLVLDAARMHTWDISLLDTACQPEDYLDMLLDKTVPHTNENIDGKAYHIYANDRVAIAEALRGVLAGDMPYDLTYRIIKPDQTLRWISTRGNVIRDEHGTPLRLVGVSMDETALWQAQQDRTHALSAFQTLAEHAPDIITRQDAKTFRYLYANPAIEAALDIPVEAFIGKTSWELGLPEELCRLFDQILTQVVKTGQPARTTNEIRGKYYLSLLVPEEDTMHHLTSILAISHDITALQTAHHQTEEALQALISVAQALVSGPEKTQEHAAGQMWEHAAQRLLDVICHTFNCTGALMKTLVPGTEVIDKLITSGFDQETDQRLKENARGQQLSQRYADISVTTRLRAGEVIALDVSQPPYRERRPRSDLSETLLVPMRLDRTLIGVITLYAVEHMQSFSQEEIMRAAAMGNLAALLIERERFFLAHEEAHARELAAQEAARQMDAFLGIVSHELKTPLTSIKANLQLADRKLQRLRAQTAARTDDGAEPLEMVLTPLERALRQLDMQNRLVNDLLDISRILADRLELQMKMCDMVQIVQEVVANQRLLTPKHQINLFTTILELPIFADTGRVEQVIINYLTNALKYSDVSQPVEVSLRVEGSNALVTVSDRGPGLTLEQQQHIWERFYQVPGTIVKSGSSIGLGLGLHISKQLIERQGGQVGVESIAGQGATFWFTLPLAKNHTVPMSRD